MDENFEVEMQKLRSADPSANVHTSAVKTPNFALLARISSRRLIVGVFAFAVLAVPGFFTIFQDSGDGGNAGESTIDRLIELPNRATALTTTTTTTTTTIPPFEFSEKKEVVVLTGSEGDLMEEVAPEGKVYTEVLFASYGNPTVTDGKFEQGSCHAENSMEIVAAAFIGKSSGELIFDASTFGDPCVGARKTFAVALEYGDDPTPETTTTVPETTTTVPETTTTVAETTTTVPETTTTLPENVAVTLTGSRFYGEPDSAVVWELSCEGSTELCDWAKVRCEGNTLDISVTGTNVRTASYTGSVSLGEGGVPKPANVNFSGTASLTILPRPVTLTPTTLSKTYGDSDPTLTFSTLGLNSGDSLSGSLTRAAGEDIGTYAVTQGTLTTENNPNYTITFVGEDLTINALPVVVTPASGQSKTYGASDPTFTYSTSPELVDGDSLTGALGRAAGDDVGTYALDLGDLANSNYTISLSGTSVDFTIDELAVVVTPASGQSKTYGSSDPVFTYSVSPELVDGDSLTGALDRVAGDDVGTYALDLGTLANSNYTITLSGTPVYFTIDELAVTVTPDSDQSKTYGADDPTFTYSVSPALVSGDSLTGALDREDGDDVGTYELDLGDLANSNYTITLSDTPVDFTIDKKPVTVTPNSDQSKTYGASDPVLTFSTLGLESGDSLTGALDRVAGDNVGTYALNLGDLANSNYTISLSGTPVDFTINELAVTVTPASGQSKTYGADDPTFTYSVSPELVDGDSLTGALGRVAGDDVGTYELNLGDLANSNYTVTLSGTPVYFTINKLAVTVTPDASQSKTYGAADPTFTYSVSPELVGTDSLTGALDRVAGDDVGTYELNLGDLANSNYTITLSGTPVNFTINKLAVTVTPDASQSKTYGSSDPVFTYSVSPELVDSDSLTGALGRVAGDDVGTYELNLGDLANTNYTITLSGTPVNFTINKLAVTVTPDASQSKTYGAADPTFTYSVSPELVGTDSLTGALDREDGDDVGTYALNLGDLANSNYTVTLSGTPVYFTIDELAVTVTPDSDQSKTYGADDPTFTYSVSPALVGTDSLTGVLDRVAGDDVGTYELNLGDLANSNYTITLSGTPVNFTINKLAVTVTPDASQSKTYGSSDPTFTYSVSPELVSGDSLSGALGRVAGDDVGTYELNLGDLANTNYTITLSGTPVDFTVNAKPVVVTPNSGQSKTYGDADPVMTFSTLGLKSGDSFTGSLGRAEGSNVGTYALNLGTLANSNYTITLSDTPVDFTINKLAVTVTPASGQSKTYGDADPTLTYTTSPVSAQASLSGSLGRSAGSSVGTYALNLGTLANSNYTITLSGTPVDFTINKLAVTVTPDASQSKTYGASDPVFTYSTSPALVGTDSLSGLLGRSAGSSVGTYALNLGTLANSNYTITLSGTPVDFTINKLAVTVTPASGQSKTYGDADPVFTYSTSPALVSGDALTGALERVSGSSVGTYALNLGTLANSNYTITLSGTPVDFTINKLAVTVTPASGQSKTYGDADPAFTYSTSPALVSGDALTGALERVSGSSVGTYALNLGTLANSNYTITLSGTPVNFTINKLAVTVTADAKSKTYGSDDPELTYSVTSGSLKSGDSFAGTLGRATGDSVGTYAINKGTLDNSNYTITFVGANLTISKRAVTVTADAKSKTYGDADPGLTYQLTGSLKSGDAFTGALARVAGENAGEYNITQGTVSLNSNYEITFVGAKLTISTRAVTVTADAKSKDFGGVDPALTYTLTSGSLKSGDSFTGALTRVAGENAGQYDIVQGTVALNSNYTITFVGAQFTINGVTVTVTPVTGQQAEIGSGYKVQLVVTGLLGTDTYTGDAAFTDALGTQAITVGTLAVGSNYSLSFTTGVTVEVVAQLPISLTWRARNGSVDATGAASIGAKLEMTATGGGSGALTWSVTGGGCNLSVVDATTQTIQKNGNGTCAVTVKRAASAGRVATQISQTFTWSNR